MALVTSTRKIILMEPGEYVEAACVAWSTVNGVQVICLGDVTISTVATADQIINIAPGAQTASFEAAITALGLLYLDHSIDGTYVGQDAIKITHTGVGKKIILILQNVCDSTATAADKFINVVHGGAENAVRIYMQGRLTDEVEGCVYFQTKDGGDRFEAHNVWLKGGFESSADAVALNILFNNCIIKHEGVSGGNGAQLLYAAFCLSEASRVFAALDTYDLAGSHTESLLFPTS